MTLLAAHGTKAQQDAWLPRLQSGEVYGTMCLSETHAGSSLTDIRTSAERRDDGSYGIRGNKMWITGGDHSLSKSIVHFVLAKLPDAPHGATQKRVALDLSRVVRDHLCQMHRGTRP